jgi:glycosyltransferase involved in cell wall biosynthesis
LMAAADGYVMSSAWEGLPMVLLEAAASALPIVATDVGGNRDIVEDGRSGMLVAPHDPTALWAAMAEVMVMAPPQRAALGQAGRAAVRERYELGRVVGLWEELYRRLLADRG